MNPDDLLTWLSSLSVKQRIATIAVIYSQLTVGTRQFFLVEVSAGKERSIIKALQGINELHHTLANWLTAYTTDESKAFPVDVLCRQLFQIAAHYRIEGFLTSAIEFARKHKPKENER
jgi:hypothetical protein